MKQFGLKQEHVEAMNHCFAQYPAIEEVVLYGSRARDNSRKNSDIDLTIIDDNLSFADLAKLENELDDLLLPYKIDLSLKRKLGNPDLISRIESEGKLFYQKESISILNELPGKYQKPQKS